MYSKAASCSLGMSPSRMASLMIRCCRWLNIVGLAMFLFILFQIAGYQYEALRMDASLFVAGMIGNVVLMLGFIIYYSVRISQVK